MNILAAAILMYGLRLLFFVSTDAISVTCQKSRHSGYYKSSVIVYCLGTIGTFFTGQSFASSFNGSW
jgi:hypothetical protein